MYWLRVSIGDSDHRLHRYDCPHIVPEESEVIGVGELKEDGGWLKFDSAGEAMKYIKDERLPGTIDMCNFCKPLDDLRTEPMATLKVEQAESSTDQNSKVIKITDTKSIWKRLSKRFLGEK
jgi:hypothetical protein